MKYTEYLEKYLHHFRYKPSSVQEVNKIEQELGITLPLAMKNFLIVTGGNYNDLIGDSGTARLDQAVSNQEQFQELLQEANEIFTEPVFVFTSWDACFFVKLATGDDPEVWGFNPQLHYEGDDYWPGYSALGYQQGFYKIDDHFSAYLIAVVNQSLVEKHID